MKLNIDLEGFWVEIPSYCNGSSIPRIGAHCSKSDLKFKRQPGKEQS
jgi:hypothetical protein